MKSRSSYLSSIGVTLALSALAVAVPAKADFMSCTGTVDGTAYDISDSVTPSDDCTIFLPTDGNDNDDASLVNDEAFFGFSDWTFDAKAEAPDETTSEGANTVGLVLSDLAFDNSSYLSGSWAINAGFDFDANDLMFVLKDGANTNLVGYLIGATSGTFESPFVDPPFPTGLENPKGISHISAYIRTGDTPPPPPPEEIPEPGTVLLIGLGLLGVGRLWRGGSGARVA